MHLIAYAKLGLAIACEVTATCMLKSSEGMTRLGPAVVVAIGYGLAVLLLSNVLESLPVGSVYAIWAGVGTAGAAAFGVWYYQEQLPLPAWIGIALVAIGVSMLGYYTPHQN